MIINFAQTLLYKQFATPGLQNTVLGYTLTYDVVCEPFVQILHNGQGYWLTVSNIGLQSSYTSTCMIVCIPPYQAKLKIKFVLFYTLIKRLFMCNLSMLINKKIHMSVVSLLLHMPQVYVMGMMFLIL